MACSMQHASCMMLARTPNLAAVTASRQARSPHVNGIGSGGRRGGEGGRRRAPEGEGAASTGSRPRSMRHCRATERPVRDQDSPLLLSCGTTSVRMGIGGLRRGPPRPFNPRAPTSRTLTCVSLTCAVHSRTT